MLINKRNISIWSIVITLLIGVPIFSIVANLLLPENVTQDYNFNLGYVCGVGAAIFFQILSSIVHNHMESST